MTGFLHFGQRREWCELVRPPTGYRLIAALGTTYNLDPVALTALLLALVDGDPERRGDDADLLRAITRLADRVRVFMHRGRLAVEDGSRANINPILGLLDRMVCEVRPTEASFHPKVWILHYAATDESGHEIIRVTCGSRNVAQTSAWELFAAFDAVVDRECAPRSDLGDLDRFAATLLEFDRTASPALAVLPEAIRFARFRFGDSVKKATFRWQGDGHLKLIDLLGRGDAVLVVSPFLGATFIDGLRRRFKEVHILSRCEALDENWAHLRFDNLHTWVMAEADDAPMGLHAKLVVCKRRETATEVFLGSANATWAGWGLSGNGNYEAVVQFPLAGKFEDMLKDLGCSTEEGLGWVERYQPRPPAEKDAGTLADELLDDVSEMLGDVVFVATYEEAAQALTLNSATPQILTAVVAEIACWGTVVARPLACDSAQFVQIAEFANASIFPGVALHQVSEFLFLQATHLATSRKKCFAIKARLEVPADFWERRRKQVLKTFLSREKFLAFLEAILIGRFDRRRPGAQGGSKSNPSTDSPFAQVFHVIAAEQVMQSCLEDATRFREVSELVDAFAPTGHVDPGFLDFWKAFSIAWVKEPRHARAH